MAMTHSSNHRRQTNTGSTASTVGRVRSSGRYGVISEHVNIPKKPSSSFVTKMRQVGAGEGTIRRATGK